MNFKRDKRDSLFSQFPLANIGDGYIEYENGYKTYFYTLNSYIDHDWNNDFQLDLYIDSVVKSLVEISSKYIINISIMGRKNSSLINEKINNKISSLKNNYLKEYLQEKREYILNQKVLTLVIGISHVENKFKEEELYFLEKSKMKDTEIYNYMYNIFNLDKYNDNLKREPENAKGLMSPLKSINSLLFESYMQETDRHLVIGDSLVSQFIISNPPPINNKYFQIGDLINSLSNLESDFIINVILRNDKDALNGFSGLAKKKMLGSGALLSYTSSMNNEIVDNIKKFNEYILKNNFIPVSTSIYFSIYHQDEKQLYSDSIKCNKIEGFEGASVIRNTYNKLPDYLGHIPGFYLRFRYNFYLSSKEMATLLLMPKVKYDSLSFFKKKSNLLTSFKFHDEKVDAPGGIIYAPPGKGKSGLLNYMLLNYKLLDEDLLGLIIDFGGSYKNLHLLFDDKRMTYTNFEIDNNTFYNIFDLEFGEEVNEYIIKLKINVLINFFKEAISSDEEEEGVLREAMEDMYNKVLFEDKFKKKEFGVENGKVYINLYNQDKTNLNAFLESMPNIQDFISFMSQNKNIRSNNPEALRRISEKIRVFIQTRGLIFSKNSTKHFLNDFLIVDLKDIATTDSKMLNIILVYLMQSKLLTFRLAKNVNRVKLLVIDEYDQFKKSSEFINQITNTIFQTGRKEKIDQFLISQNIGDFDLKMFNSCGYIIAFNPNTYTEIEKLHEITKFPIEELDMLDKNIKTKKGEYSEFVVFTNNDKKERTRLRFQSSKFDYYSFITSDPKDTEKLNELLIKHNGNISKSIKTMIELNK